MAALYPNKLTTSDFFSHVTFCVRDMEDANYIGKHLYNNGCHGFRRNGDVLLALIAMNKTQVRCGSPTNFDYLAATTACTMLTYLIHLTHTPCVATWLKSVLRFISPLNKAPITESDPLQPNFHYMLKCLGGFVDWKACIENANSACRVSHNNRYQRPFLKPTEYERLLAPVVVGPNFTSQHYSLRELGRDYFFTLQFNPAQHKSVSFSMVQHSCGRRLFLVIACLARMEVITGAESVTFNFEKMCQEDAALKDKSYVVVSVLPFYREWFDNRFMEDCHDNLKNTMLSSVYYSTLGISNDMI